MANLSASILPVHRADEPNIHQVTHGGNFSNHVAPPKNDRIPRLVIVLGHQQHVDLPAFAAARRGRDTILVEGMLDGAFAAILRSSGCRLAAEAGCGAPLEVRIAQALRWHSARRIAVTDPGDPALYKRLESWASMFGVSVDIYRAGAQVSGQRTAA